VRQLLKDPHASEVLKVPDEKTLTPIKYALRDMLRDPSDKQCKPIDLETLDLLCPEYSEQALESDFRGMAAGGDNDNDEQLGCMHIRGSREKTLRFVSEIARRGGLSNVSWARDFSALHLAAKYGSKDHVRQLLKDPHASEVLKVPDEKTLTPIKYALRDMLRDPSASICPPPAHLMLLLRDMLRDPSDMLIDLEMLDLLCPEYSEQALKSDPRVMATGSRCRMAQRAECL